MKIFEQEISALLRQGNIGTVSEELITDPQKEHAQVETISGDYTTVTFGNGVNLDEIEEKTEYRKRRSVRALD